MGYEEGDMERVLAAILLALVLVWALRALVGFIRTHRRARALMQDYREGGDAVRGAIEREAEAKRELRERMRPDSRGRWLFVVLLLALAALVFLRS